MKGRVKMRLRSEKDELGAGWEKGKFFSSEKYPPPEPLYSKAFRARRKKDFLRKSIFSLKRQEKDIYIVIPKI